MRRAALAAVLFAILAGAGAYLAFFKPTPGVNDILPRAAPLSLPKDQLRIVAFGTSLTANQVWPESLSDELTRCFGIETAVHVVAAPGQGSAWALDHIGDVTELDPHLVLAEFAINDADILDGVSLSESYAAHIRISEMLSEAQPETVLTWMTMSPASGPRRWVRPRLAAHYKQYRTIAKDSNAGLIDLWPRWLELPRAERHMGDGLHPDPETAAAVIVPVIVERIAVMYGLTCA